MIDEDTFLPHNAARHLLPSFSSGFSKAGNCKCILNRAINEPLVDDAFCLNVLNPRQEESKNLRDILENQDFIFDFSASIAVSHYLANSDSFVRSMSAYLTPNGKCLVLAMEDEKRSIRLDWLEMLQYREVINDSLLFNSLNVPEYHRYGNSCRDISVRLSQDDFAIWSGFSSKKIRENVQKTDASLDIFVRCNFEIKHIVVDISNIVEVKISSWKIIFDEYLINKMSKYRETSLPNETGGVLLGNFDTEYEKCYIIDILSAPSDSEELPISFLRGCEGLSDEIENIKGKTLGQVMYVGEWHSHPNGYSTNPSVADAETFKWLKSNLDQDSIPSIMMIIGENQSISIIGAEPPVINP